MSERKIIREILNAAKISAKGRNERALKKLNKIRLSDINDYTASLLDFHQGLCEAKKGNIDTAVSMLKRSAETLEKDGKQTLASISYLRLGDILCTDNRYDDACKALCKAETLSENFLHLCEIKTVLAAARMASDTVYDTSLFIEPCEFMLPCIESRKADILKYFARAALIAAKACSAINDYIKSTEYCLHCINACTGSKDVKILNAAAGCAELLCHNAVLSGDKNIIECSATAAYEFINSNPLIDEESTDFVKLLYARCLLDDNQVRKAKIILSSIDSLVLNDKLKICFEYCNCLCRQSAFDISINETVKKLIPEGNIDTLNTLAESVVDSGFPEAAAEIYLYSLDLYNDVKPLITRPLASLLYKLGRYDECVKYYAELTEEYPDPILKRAYSLSCIKSGNTETAKAQLLKYINSSEDRVSALTVGSMLALDEGYPSDFSAELYTELSDILEKSTGSTTETVDAYNRLGICLYRCGAPLEEEANAFKKAVSHAKACDTTRNSNIHAVILCNLAECCLRNKDLDQCYDTYTEAESIFSNISDPDIIQYTSCLKFVSDILLIRDDPDGAIEKLKKAISLLEPYASSDKSYAQQLSLCHNTLGTIYFRQGKPELEIPELTKAIDLVKDQPIDNSSLSLLYSNRGEAYECTGEYELMLSDYMTFITLTEDDNTAEKPDTKFSQATKWLSIGRHRENSLQHTEAINAYNSALSLLDGLSLQDETEADELAAFAYYQLGNAYCHNNVKNYSAGLGAYTRSLNILSSLPMNNTRKAHLASTYEARSAFYEIFGEHSLSSADLIRANELRMSISD